MDLNNHQTLGEQISQSNVLRPVGTKAADSSLVARLASYLPVGSSTSDPLVQAMLSSRVLAGVAGWVLDRARISQQVIHRGAEGDPTFVGFGKPQPEFSQLDLGVVLKPDQVQARDIVPASYFPYIAIFALVGSLLASILDRKDRGQFWRMQTLGLRILTWPLLLVSAGNLALDYGLRNFTTAAVDNIVMIYSALWWLIPARLLAISVERFLWVPLEIRTGRKIPNIIRRITSLVIYLFAFFGVVAFVMGQTITSLLATSGLLAMIIGLAIQANIANIFSGIILNIERPFKVGDYVKLNANIMGEVIDITWRTIRIRHLEGQLVSLANAKVSEAEVHNFSDMGPNFVRLQLFVDPKYDPRLVSRLIKESLDTFNVFQNVASNYFGPDAQFKGVECTNGIWAARYRVKFQLMKGHDENKVVHEVWVRVWERFQVNGIEWAAPGHDIDAQPPMITVADHKALPAAAS
jgi:branched-chain amino acid transport system substrate-binding protein